MDWTDELFNKEMAERVMGWKYSHRIPDGPSDFCRGYVINLDMRHVRYFGEWNPATDLVDMFEVQQALSSFCSLAYLDAIRVELKANDMSVPQLWWGLLNANVDQRKAAMITIWPEILKHPARTANP